jgi:hypothetical protein
VAFALAALTRETMLLGLIPPAIESLRRRDVRRVIGWASAAVPLLVWWAYVHSQSGQWPPLAHAAQRDRAIAFPFVGIVEAWGHGGYRLAMLLAAVTVLAGLASAVWLRSDNPALAHAVVFCAFISVFGPEVWPYWGDTWRLLLPAQVFILLGAVTAATRGRRESSTTARAPTADGVDRAGPVDRRLGPAVRH